jgi:uncharacterized protein YcfJ
MGTIALATSVVLRGRSMRRDVSILVLAAALVSGCAAQSNWTPTVDTYGDSRAQYASQDLWECRQLAQKASGGTATEVAKGGLLGGLVGAAAGAAIGAAAGNPGMGAAVGAAAGGIGYGTVKGAQSDASYKRTYENCMRNRGHQVIN